MKLGFEDWFDRD